MKEKNIVIIGMGKSGFSALKLLVREKANVWAINIGNIETWPRSGEIIKLIGKRRCVTQEDPSTQEVLAVCHLIVLSPGISEKIDLLANAIKKGVPIWSEIELGYQFCQSPIIALTGTNGKTTTVSILAEVLKQSGLEVFVGGNIGIPFCEYALDSKKYDYVILELSSFQLEHIVNFHPIVAIILNITQNHGERYQQFTDYVQAKLQIIKNSRPDDILIYSSNIPGTEQINQQWRGKKIAIDPTTIEKIKERLEKNYDFNKYHLYGRHNYLNLYFAYKTVESLKILNDQSFQKTIDIFRAVEHRMELIENESSLLTVINDAKSTNWSATQTALNSIDKGKKQITLILGGQKRGRGDVIPKECMTIISAKVDNIILIGETAESLSMELKRANVSSNTSIQETLQRSIDYIKKQRFTGLVLFSPAFPSFDQFSNYQERGSLFKNLVKNL